MNHTPETDAHRRLEHALRDRAGVPWELPPVTLHARVMDRIGAVEPVEAPRSSDRVWPTLAAAAIVLLGLAVTTLIVRPQVLAPQPPELANAPTAAPSPTAEAPRLATARPLELAPTLLTKLPSAADAALRRSVDDTLMREVRALEADTQRAARAVFAGVLPTR